MKKFLIVATAVIAFAGISAASADECSGRDHDTGTAVGAVGGAAIGGLASHSIVGAIAGGVVGGFAGNAVDRAQDCDNQRRADAQDQRDAYNQGYEDRAYDDNQAREEYAPQQ